MKEVSMIVSTLSKTPVWSWKNLEIYGALSCYLNNYRDCLFLVGSKVYWTV